jgi:hypothetical protein
MGWLAVDGVLLAHALERAHSKQFAQAKEGETGANERPARGSPARLVHLAHFIGHG